MRPFQFANIVTIGCSVVLYFKGDLLTSCITDDDTVMAKSLESQVGVITVRVRRIRYTSKAAREGVVDGCITFATRPIGSVETRVI